MMLCFTMADLETGISSSKYAGWVRKRETCFYRQNPHDKNEKRLEFDIERELEIQVDRSHAAHYLYLAHTFLELFLGVIKLRGRYQHEPVSSRNLRSQMYVRHHAASLLALALLGGLVYARGWIDTRVGRDASAVLALFHGGAVVSFAYTWLCDAQHCNLKKVMFPHAPFAVMFAWHWLI